MFEFHTNQSVAFARPSRRKRRGPTRSGSVLVFFALILTTMLAMVGLVIDGGLLMAAQRHASNAADAAALAAAHELLYGRPRATATATATTFVKEHNGLASAPDPEVNIPPKNGPYAGMPNYVEVIVTSPARTYVMNILPGVGSQHTVKARAVAGFEFITSGAGVTVLDPNARPGLNVGGSAILKVNGRVFDNSEGGGVDENGDPVNNGNNGTAGSVSNNARLLAHDIRIVGGVDNPENFEDYDQVEGRNVLHTRQLPVPDPLINLATPTVATGVDPAFRGAPQATNANLKLGDNEADSPRLNYVDVDPITNESTMILHPGIYTSINITGGNVEFLPGIYVLKPEANTQNTLKITGGNVLAEGIMFYNTGDNYDPQDGTPDIYDAKQSPPADDGANFGGITINAGMRFSPINFDEHSYDPAHHPAEEFEGMLFYQRRRNDQDVNFQGDAEEGNLSGTLYAKWANFKIAGQGIFDAQFVIGSLDVTGQGDVVVGYAGDKLGKAPNVFLVE